MPAASRRLVPLEEAAEYSHLSVKNWRRYIIAGRIKAYRIGPKLILLDLDRVDRLIRPIPDT